MVLADFQILAAVKLMGCRKFDTAVAKLLGVPVHKICNPQAALHLTGKWLVRIIGPVVNGVNNEFD